MTDQDWLDRQKELNHALRYLFRKIWIQHSKEKLVITLFPFKGNYEMLFKKLTPMTTAHLVSFVVANTKLHKCNVIATQEWYETDQDKTGWDTDGWTVDGEEVPEGYELYDVIENDKYGHPTKAIFLDPSFEK